MTSRTCYGAFINILSYYYYTIDPKVSDYRMRLKVEFQPPLWLKKTCHPNKFKRFEKSTMKAGAFLSDWHLYYPWKRTTSEHIYASTHQPGSRPEYTVWGSGITPSHGERGARAYTGVWGYAPSGVQGKAPGYGVRETAAPHSTTGGRIATRTVALTRSLKKLLRLNIWWTSVKGRCHGNQLSREVATNWHSPPLLFVLAF